MCNLVKVSLLCYIAIPIGTPLGFPSLTGHGKDGRLDRIEKKSTQNWTTEHNITQMRKHSRMKQVITKLEEME
jgi:hypothetical protein